MVKLLAFLLLLAHVSIMTEKVLVVNNKHIRIYESPSGNDFCNFDGKADAGDNVEPSTKVDEYCHSTGNVKTANSFATVTSRGNEAYYRILLPADLKSKLGK